MAEGTRDASVILGVVILNAIIGFVQETRAIQAINALAKSVVTQATVTRDGKRLRVDSGDLVPGDIVTLAAGDKVPADLRLIESSELRIAEACLTGESLAVEKQTKPLDAAVVLADRTNMAYSATLVTAGQGVGLVVATVIRRKLERSPTCSIQLMS